MKIVNESLNELYKFEKKSDPLVSLGVGKRSLIEKWLDKMEIKNYIIDDNDLTIDIKNSLYIDFKYIVKFPDYIQFNIINGDFDCTNNKLISLKGCPRVVYGDFNCAVNDLINLEYSPEIIQGTFCCQYNNLITLKGCTKIIQGDFECHNNKLENFKGCPKIVKGNFIGDNQENGDIIHNEYQIRKLCDVKGYIQV